MTTHKVYESVGATAAEWTYSADANDNNYRVSVVAPDGMQTDNFMYRGHVASNCNQIVGDADNQFGTRWGYDNVLAGRTHETRTFSSDNPKKLIERTFTRYATTQAGMGSPTPSPIPIVLYPTPTKTLQVNARVASTQSITYHNGEALSAVTKFTYDLPDDYGSPLNVKEKFEYAYLPVSVGTLPLPGEAPPTDVVILPDPSTGALVRKTVMTYQNAQAYKDKNILRLPIEVLVKNASDAIVAKTQIGYDGLALLDDYSGTVPGWTDPGTNPRGLATSSTTWHDINANQSITTQTQYNKFGSPRKTWDGNNNVSEIQYADNFSDGINRYTYAHATTSISPIPYGNGSTSAFVSTVKYKFETGQPVSSLDANGLETRMEYVDPLLRPTKVGNFSNNQPVGAVTETYYGQPDSGGQYPATERYVRARSQIDASNWKEGYTFSDGLGRSIRTRSIDDDGDVTTLTCYDNAGRVSKATNPFRGYSAQDCSTTTGLEWTTNTFDTSGRPFKVTTPDGAEVETAYGVATSGTHWGTVVTVTDQAEKQRRSITNAFGQLTRVDEPNNAGQLDVGGVPAQPTIYTYDLLNNLITLTHGVQTRSFTYDAMSRLKSAANPESGTILSTFDANGNIKTQRDSRGIKTIFDYDALNRINKKCFRVIGGGSLGATSCSAAGGEQVEPNTTDVTYYYDASTASFPKGKLTKVENGISTSQFTAFDSVGNIISHKQSFGGSNYLTAYTYNLGGDLLEETYPSGRVVKNTYDQNGDLSQVLSKKTPSHGFFAYADHFTYTPSGRVISMSLGNNAWESVQLNSRLQPTQIALGTTQNAADLWKINYEFGELQTNGTVNLTKNNSSIGKQIITVPTIGQNSGFVAEQTFTYDSLKRLKIATEKIGGSQIWKQSFNYDQFGNRTFDAANTTTIPVGCSTALCNPAINASDNKISTGQGYLFDESGNLTQNADNQKFVYDALNKIAEVRNASTNALISKNYYDGDGTRVKIDENGVTTFFIYDAFDKIVAEYTVNAPANENPKVNYLTTDLLGSPRVITDENREVFSRRDLTPFGEEIAVGVGSRSLGQQYSVVDGVRPKFTGQQRDETVKIDYFNARHYAFKLGRFMSADSLGGKLSNPQTLNLYAYAVNNPLKWVDPTGHFIDDPEKLCNNCHVDDRGRLIREDGTVWSDMRAIVNVSSDDSGYFSVATKTASLPVLADSAQDNIPFWGPLRGMAFNMNCRIGGCNFTRALGNFGLLALDLGTLGSWSWARSTVRAGAGEAGEIFAREVISETAESGATTIIRQPQSLMDQMVLDAAMNGAGQPIISNLGDDAFKGMTKMAYSELSAQGIRSEVHFVKNPLTGILSDFKFKPSTIQKTNSATQYSNVTKNGTIVPPK